MPVLSDARRPVGAQTEARAREPQGDAEGQEGVMLIPKHEGLRASMLYARGIRENAYMARGYLRSTDRADIQAERDWSSGEVRHLRALRGREKRKYGVGAPR